MPLVEISLNDDELALLGTHNQDEAEETLKMLAEVALLDIPEQILDAAIRHELGSTQKDTRP